MKILTRLPFFNSLMAWPMLGFVLLLMAFSNVPPVKVINPAAGKADADIKVLGTSNLHNWSMEDKVVSCTATFTYATGKTSIPNGLEAFGFSFPVHSLTSGKSGMDSKAYDALKAKTNANIVFTATSSTLTPGSDNQFNVKSDGNLTIAGVTKPVVLKAACTVKPDGSISCIGTSNLLMSDYQIKPPTYMMGALKTGNALTIDFTMIVKK